MTLQKTSQKAVNTALAHQNGGGRSSSFELLRVIAMLGIVMFHITYHDILEQQLYDPNYGGYFNVPQFFNSMLLLTTLMTLGPLGNSLFLLISGYFTCSGENHLSLTRIGSKLLTQLAFASVVLVIASPIVRYFVPADLIQYQNIYLMEITIFNEKSWYVGYYFMIMAMAALFLNKYLAKLDLPQYATFLVVLFALTQCVYSGEMLHDTITHGRQICYGVLIYTLGGAIRRFHLFDKVRTWAVVATIAITYALVWMSYYNATVDRIDHATRDGWDIFTQSIPYPSDESIIILVIAVAVFELFRRMPSFRSPFINFLGSASFMVYLIHDNEMFISLWDIQHWTQMLRNDKPLFAIRFLVWSFGTFAIGVLCYIIYIGLGQLLRRCRRIYIKE